MTILRFSRFQARGSGLAVLLFAGLAFAQLAFGGPPVLADGDNKIFELGGFR
jgi:hypothetical protein